MIPVNRTLYAYDRLNLGNYANFYYYRGYRVTAVEISADAYGYSSELSLIFDGMIDQTRRVPRDYSYLVMYPTRYVQIGYNTHEISLMARGSDSIYIRHVVLRLSR